MDKQTIIAVMKKYGYTQVKLADAMGIARQSLDNALNSDMRTSTLERIADAMGVSVAEFYGGASCKCPHCGKPINISIS